MAELWVEAELTEDFSIVAATPPDIPALARLFDAYRVFYKQPSDSAASEAYIAGEVTNGNTRFFLARSSITAAIGFVHLIPATNTLVMRPIWYLEDLFVDPSARRKGVGKALMQTAERFARATGAERLTLATANDNHAAQALYRKLGYIREDHFQYFHRLLH